MEVMDINQQERQIRDDSGKRWIMCQYCGKVDTDDAFVVYGGAGTINMGICRDCSHNPVVMKAITARLLSRGWTYGKAAEEVAGTVFGDDADFGAGEHMLL